MNAERRRRIASITERVAVLEDALGKLAADVREIADDIDNVRDEEQEAYDALPESLQGADRGQQMQTAIEALERVQTNFADLADTLEAFDASTDELNTASE
jgi:methyl-accepting chemotaxis protein